MALHSIKVPLIGTALVWLGYGVFALIITAAREDGRITGPSAGDAGDAAAAGGPNIADRRAALQRPAPEPLAPLQAAGTPVPASTAVPAAAVPAPLSPEDAELVALMSGRKPEEAVAGLEGFVAAHPQHALGRALLVSLLFNTRRTVEEIRPHVEALCALMPEFAVPEFLRARLMLLDGNAGMACALLADAARKDLTWFPDSELVRLQFTGELAAGTAPIDILSKAVVLSLPFSRLARAMAKHIHDAGGGVPGPGFADPDLRAEAGRAMMRIGAGMADHGLLLVENQVGGALIESARPLVEGAGELTDAERAMVAHSTSLHAAASIVPAFAQEVMMSSPHLMAQYLETVITHGELRAARRGFMDYLSGGGR